MLGAVGYGGKVREQELARELRAEAWTLQDIANELGVSKSSVSLWVRDVEFAPNPRRRARAPRPHGQHLRKLAEIERCNEEGIADRHAHRARVPRARRGAIRR